MFWSLDKRRPFYTEACFYIGEASSHYLQKTLTANIALEIPMIKTKTCCYLNENRPIDAVD